MATIIVDVLEKFEYETISFHVICTYMMARHTIKGTRRNQLSPSPCSEVSQMHMPITAQDPRSKYGHSSPEVGIWCPCISKVSRLKGGVGTQWAAFNDPAHSETRGDLPGCSIAYQRSLQIL